MTTKRRFAAQVAATMLLAAVALLLRPAPAVAEGRFSLSVHLRHSAFTYDHRATAEASDPTRVTQSQADSGAFNAASTGEFRLTLLMDALQRTRGPTAFVTGIWGVGMGVRQEQARGLLALRQADDDPDPATSLNGRTIYSPFSLVAVVFDGYLGVGARSGKNRLDLLGYGGVGLYVPDFRHGVEQLGLATKIGGPGPAAGFRYGGQLILSRAGDLAGVTGGFVLGVERMQLSIHDRQVYLASAPTRLGTYAEGLDLSALTFQLGAIIFFGG
jgi:hypothetical protein